MCLSTEPCTNCWSVPYIYIRVYIFLYFKVAILFQKCLLSLIFFFGNSVSIAFCNKSKHPQGCSTQECACVFSVCKYVCVGNVEICSRALHVSVLTAWPSWTLPMVLTSERYSENCISRADGIIWKFEIQIL